MSIYLSILHYQYSVYIDRIKQMKIMRNNNTCFSFCPPYVDLSSKELDSTDIKSRIYLIEEYSIRIKELDLKHFDTSFFPTRESYIEISIEK